MIRSAGRTTLCSLLRSDLVAELNQTAFDMQRMDSMMAKYNCLLSWKKEVQPLLGLFVKPWTQSDCSTSDPEKLWCPGIWIHFSHSAVHDSKWVESRWVSPEVHDHLHCFERVKLQVVKTAPDRQLLNLLSVSRLVTILNEADQCGVVSKL